MTSKVHVNLMSFTKGAQIHYTLDGSDPNEESSVFDLSSGLLTLKLDDVDEGKKDFLIKIIAKKEGYQDSDIASFTYSVSSWPKGEKFYGQFFKRKKGIHLLSFELKIIIR